MKLPDDWTPMDETAARERVSRKLAHPTTMGVSDVMAMREADMVLKGYAAEEIRTALDANFP